MVSIGTIFLKFRFPEM